MNIDCQQISAPNLYKLQSKNVFNTSDVIVESNSNEQQQLSTSIISYSSILVDSLQLSSHIAHNLLFISIVRFDGELIVIIRIDELSDEYRREFVNISDLYLNNDQIIHRTIVCTAFSPNAHMLACLHDNGSLSIVPIHLFMNDMPNDDNNQIVFISLLTRDDCLQRPTCAVWYETRNSRRPIIIYSNKAGEIIIVDVILRIISACLEAPQTIHTINIISDASNDVFILVTGFTGTQWLIPLEMRNQSMRETLSSIIPSNLNQLSNTIGNVCSVQSADNVQCIGVFNSDNNLFQIFNTISFDNAVIEFQLPINSSFVHYADTVVFSVSDQNELIVSSNFCDSSTVKLQQTIGNVPFGQLLGFIGSKSSSSILPCVYLITEIDLYIISPICSMIDLFLWHIRVGNQTIAESFCLRFSLSFDQMCMSTVEYLFTNHKSSIDDDTLAIRLCQMSKMSNNQIANLYDRYHNRLLLSLLVRQCHNNKDILDEHLLIRIVNFFTSEIHVIDNVEQRTGLELELQSFLVHHQCSVYRINAIIDSLFDAHLWTCISIIQFDQQYIVQALIQLHLWPIGDNAFFAIITQLNFDLLIDQCYQQLFQRLVHYAQRLDTYQQLITLHTMCISITKPSSCIEINDYIARLILICTIRLLYDSSLIRQIVPVSSYHQLNNRRVIACGSSITLICTNAGVYLCGDIQMVKRRPLLATLALSKLSLSSQSTESNNEISFSQPRLIYSDKQIESVCAGAEHCLLLTVDGQVLVHGSNRYGQLGIGNRESVSIGIQRCIFDDTIGSIFSGQYHCAALSRNNGRVYCWGWGLHGQLALADQIGVEDSLSPIHVRYFDDRSIVSIACGYAHTIFLDVNGKVFVCGNNAYGQLGIGGTYIKQSSPIQLVFDTIVTIISTGLFHSIALTDQHRLYIWGSTPQALKFKTLLQKRRNLNNTTDKSANSSMSLPIHGVTNDGPHMRPIEIQLNSALSNGREHIIAIECGLHHSALLTNLGHIYTWGKSLEMQLGHGDKKERSTPTLLTSINDTRQWRHLACGSEFTMAIDRNGCIWGWGRNDQCQLGFESTKASNKSTCGKVVTIERANRERRTITLPPDNSSFIGIPTRLNTLIAVDIHDNDNNISIDQLCLIDALKQCAKYDQSIDITISLCEQYCSHNKSLVWLIYGRVYESIQCSSNSSKLFQLYQSLLHHIDNRNERINIAIALITTIPIININLDIWSSIIVDIIRTNQFDRINQLIDNDIILRSIRHYSKQKMIQKPIEIDQSIIDNHDIIYHWIGCNHLTTNRYIHNESSNIIVDIINRQLFDDQLSTKCPQCVYNDIIDIQMNYV